MWLSGLKQQKTVLCKTSSAILKHAILKRVHRFESCRPHLQEGTQVVKGAGLITVSCIRYVDSNKQRSVTPVSIDFVGSNPTLPI